MHQAPEYPSTAGHQTISILEHRCFSAIGREAWSIIFDDAESVSAFQSYEWLSAWWEVFGKGRRLALFAAYENKMLCGIAPLMYVGSPSRFQYKEELRFVGEEHSDYQMFIVSRGRSDVLDVLLAAVVDAARNSKRAILRDVPTTCPLGRMLSLYAQSKPLVILERDQVPCPRIELSEENVSEFLGKDSPRRHAKKLSKLGRMTIQHLHTWEEIEPVLPAFFRQHVERWSVTQYPSLFVREENRQFYLAVSKFASQGRRIVMTRVDVDERPVAMHFGILSGGDLIWYKPTFDLRLNRCSPGEVMLRELVIYAHNRGLSGLDFSRGDEGFKKRFATETRYVSTFEISGNRLSAAGSRAALFAHSIIDRLPENSKPRTILRSMRSCWVSVARRGLTETVIRIARQLTKHVYQRSTIDIFLGAPANSIEEVCSEDDLTVTAADLAILLDRYEPDDEQHVTLLRSAFTRIRKGDTCFLALYNDRIAGYGWATSKSPIRITEIGQGLTFGPEYMCLYDFHVFTPFRNRGVYTSLLRQIRGILHSKSLIIYVMRQNSASRRAISNAGFVHFLTVDKQQIAGRLMRQKERGVSDKETGNVLTEGPRIVE